MAGKNEKITNQLYFHSLGNAFQEKHVAELTPWEIEVPGGGGTSQAK